MYGYSFFCCILAFCTHENRTENEMAFKVERKFHFHGFRVDRKKYVFEKHHSVNLCMPIVVLHVLCMC